MIPYAEYLRSPQWQARRKRYKQNHPWRCFICGDTGKLHLHHRTYKRLGHEWDMDLLYLCPECHRQTHEIDMSFADYWRILTTPSQWLRRWWAMVQ